MKLPLRPGWRRATAEEVAEDRQKRDVALERAIEAGLIADRDVDRYRADIHEFAGYDRCIADDPPRIPVSAGKPRWRAFEVDSEFIERSIAHASAFVQGMADEWLRQTREREAAVVKAALTAGCGYAVIEERKDGFMDLTITYHYMVSSWIPPLRRLDFPSWEAWELWQERGRPL